MPADDHGANGTGFAPATLIELLRRRAELQPDHCAYTFIPDDANLPEQSITCAELDHQARVIAARLQELGASGARVLLLYPSGLEYIAALFGCLYAGAIAVPTYPPRPHRDLHRLEALNADAQATLALTTPKLLARLEPRVSSVATLRRLHWLTPETLCDDLANEWREPDINSETIAYLQYTSGSTAVPRGVVLKHDNVMANLVLIQRSFQTSGARSVFWLPLYHDMGLIGGILQPLYAGSESCTLLSPHSFLQSPVRWLDNISRNRAGISGGPNFAYDLCVRRITHEQRAHLDLSCWQLAFTGAEPIRAGTLERFTEAFAPCGFRREFFYACYGLAEASLLVTAGEKTSPPVLLDLDGAALSEQRVQPPDPALGNRRTLVSSGQALSGEEVLAVNPVSLIECGAGEIGEIWVKGASVAAGYWNKPEETHAVFEARLAGRDDGPFLRTGDLGFTSEGEWFITGRIKDVIIIRGRNYHPHDLEATVEREHPEIRPGACAAFAVEASGAEQVVIVAEVERRQLRRDLSPLAQSIRHAVAEEHELLAEAVVLVKPGEIPKTTSGKVRRRACRELFLESRLEVIARWSANGTADSTAANAIQSQPVPGAPEGPSVSVSSEEEASGTPKSAESDGSAYSETARAEHSPTIGAAEISRARTQDILGWLRQYASERINSRLMDERRSIPPYIVLDFGNRGILGMEVGESYGGIALRTRDALRIIEQLAAIDLTLASFVGVNNVLGVRPISRFAAPEMRDELLPLLARGRELAAFALTEPGAGSNPRAIASSGIPDGSGGWRLRGEKSWIGSGSWAGAINVFVKLPNAPGEDGDITGFVVRQGASGLRHGAEALTLGMRGMVQNAIHLEDVAVTKRDLLGVPGAGFDVAQDAMMLGRLGLGAMSVGAMKRCAQLMLRYAMRREIGTGRLLDNPVTLARLSDLTAQIMAVEALVSLVANLSDEGVAVPVEAFVVCKIAGPEFLWSAADMLVQLLGGRGYIESNIAPQILRDARLLRIFEGPTETLNLFLGSSVLHEGPFYEFLRVRLKAVEIAAELRDSVSELDGRFPHFCAVFPDSTSARRWIAALAGQLATQALLCAVLHEASITKASAGITRALEWSRLLFAETKKKALGNMPSPLVLLTSPMATQLINGYAGTIGDVEQVLAGEDVELDPMLRRDTGARRAGALPGSEVTWQPEHATPARLADTGGQMTLDKSGESTTPSHEAKKATEASAPAGAGPASEVILTQLRSFLTGALRVSSNNLDWKLPLYRLGLDSLVALELKNHIEESFGMVLPVTTFLEEITLEQLASQIAGHSELPDPSPVARPDDASEYTEHPLSHGQQALWLLHQLAPESTAYNVAIAFLLNGPVDSGALGRSLEALAHRHPALGATFGARDGEPVQRLHRNFSIALSAAEATTMSERQLCARLATEARQPFDLTKGPLFRATLFNRGEGQHALLMVHHHIIADAWSLGLILYELTQLYAQEKSGRPSNLPHLSLTYTDHVRHQREMLSGLEGERLWSYWRKQLSGAPLALQLPVDRPRPAVQSFRGATHTVRLNEALTRKLISFCEHQGVTLFMALVAAFQALLHRYTEEDDILVGSPMFARGRAELANVVGYLVNPVVLRSRLKGNATFTEFLQQVRSTVLEAFAHQDYPFPLLVERLQPARDLSRSPLFQVMFTLQKDLPDNLSLLTGARMASGSTLDLAGVPLKPLTLPHDFAQFDLSLMIIESRAGLDAAFEYNCDLFDATTITRVAAQFETLLDGIVSAPGTRVRYLPLLPEGERCDLLTWGGNLPGAKGSTAEARAPSDEERKELRQADAGVKFSLFYFSANEAEFTEDKYTLLMEGARRADRDGFAAVWTPERHFHPFGGLYPNPSVLGAALAMITERVRIRAGSVVLPLHNPIRVAEEWAVVDNLSRGRVDLAFATGWGARDFVLAPEHHARRKEVMFSSIEIVRQLWRGDCVVLPDASGNTTEVKIHPLPMQSELPVWIACFGNTETFRAAGRIGANVLTTLMLQPVDELALRIKAYREERERHGHDPATGQVTVMLHTFVGEDLNAVRAQVHGPFTDYLRTSYELWRHDSRELNELNEREQSDLLAYSFERYFQTSALFGTPHTCALMVESLRACGVGEIACLIDFGVKMPAVMAGFHSLNELRERFATTLTSREEPLSTAATLVERQPSSGVQTVQQLIEAQAERTPDAIALICEGESLTYREMNAGANRLAHRLRKLGLGPEGLAGILMERSLEMVIAMLGVLKAGGAYVPLDPTYPRARLSYILEDAAIAVLIAHKDLLNRVPKANAPIIALDAEPDENAMVRPEDLPPLATEKNLAYVIYTSGSTGRPKGVQVEHGAVVNFLEALRLETGLTAQDKLLAVTTLSFDIAVLELLLPLTTGAAVEIASREVAADGARLAERLSSSGATLMQATPATWRLLLEAGWQGEKRLRILCGGEALSRELANELIKRAETCWNMYGPSETVIWSAMQRLQENVRVSLGRPIANTQLYVLNRYLQLAPTGVPGELYIGGAGLARGYLNQPDITAARFLPDPFSGMPGARIYRTGDTVRYLPDGSLEFLGRRDQQVKVRGYRIELGEIASVLRAHPDVQDALVVAREDVPGDQRLFAYLIPNGTINRSDSELRDFLRERLPDYMIPGNFIFLREWPLTANGKVNSRALPAVNPSVAATRDYAVPQTNEERVIATAWQEVLRVERVGLHDNFFDLGGHSLLMAQVHSRLRDRLGLELSMVDLFRYPTVNSLAVHLSEAGGSTENLLKDTEGRARVRRAALTRRYASRREQSGGDGSSPEVASDTSIVLHD